VAGHNSAEFNLDYSRYCQALAKNENNYKVMFRKGKALGELGFFLKAEKVLEELKTKNSAGLYSF
jgi:hypothetical protein